MKCNGCGAGLPIKPIAFKRGYTKNPRTGCEPGYNIYQCRRCGRQTSRLVPA